MRELKWTDTSYRLLYEKLTEKFGPEWEKAHSPGRGLDEEYKAFLEAFAIVVGVDGDDPPRGGVQDKSLSFRRPLKPQT